MGWEKNKTERRRPALSTAFFLTGIFIISLSLMLSNCGKAQQKSIISDGGSFAIDLGLASGAKQGIVVLVNPIINHPSLNGTDFTVEAWVKSSSNADGGIFSRYSAAGIALYSATSTARFVLRIPASPTAADYIVNSGVNINDGAWHHIAATLVSVNHLATHATSSSTCTNAARQETPHLDIYVDGTYRNCASTWGGYDSASAAQHATSTEGFDTAFLGRMNDTLDGLDGTVRWDGIIDEVRLYKVAKTEAEINATMNRELSSSEIASVDLIGYWKNNVGIGSTTPDYTGGGYNGTIYQCDAGQTPTHASCVMWNNSWVAGDWP